LFRAPPRGAALGAIGKIPGQVKIVGALKGV
jgi:hypothetical protein